MPPELEQRLTLWAQRLEMSRQELVVQALGKQLDSLETATLPGSTSGSQALQKGD